MIFETPTPGIVSDLVMSMITGDKTQQATKAALIAMRPDPTLASAWADLEDCVANILNRLSAGTMQPFEAVNLLRRVLAAG